MTKRILTTILKIICCFLSVLFIVFTILFVRLSVKPIDASFLLPLVEKKIKIPPEIAFSALYFDWDKTSWGPRFQINDAKWVNDEQSLYLGDISVSLNVTRLTRLNFRLEKVVLSHLRIEAVKKDNKIDFHLLNNRKNKYNRNNGIMHISAEDYDKFYRYIQLLGNISVENVNVYIHDQDIGHTYQLPYISLQLEAKDDDFLILGYLDDKQTILQKGGQVFVSLNKNDLSFKGRLLIENFDIVAVKDYGPLYNAVKPYWPIKGSANTTIESDFKGSLAHLEGIKSLKDFNFTAQWKLYGQDISLTFPDWPDKVTEVEEIKAIGTFNMADLIVAFQAIEIKAQPEKPLYFPETDAAFPIKSTKATGFLDIDDMTFNITNAEITTDKYNFHGSYKAQFKSGKNAHSFSVQIPLMESVDALSLWPKNSGKQAHQWVSKNIKSGQIQGLLSMRMDRRGYKDWAVNFNSHLDLENVLFSYTPKTGNAFVKEAQLTMLGDEITINAPITTTGNMDFYNGYAQFSNLNGHSTNTPILMNLYFLINLKAQNLITYLESFNPDMLKESGFSAAQFTGDIIGDFGIKMALDDKLSEASISTETLGLYGQGEVKEMSIQKAFNEKDIAAQSLKYTLTPQKIRFSGLANYGTQKVDISYFDIYTIAKKRAWDIKATTTASIDEINKNFPDAQKGLNAIKAQGSVTASVTTQAEALKVAIDLKNTSFVIPGINYHKAKAATATLNTDISINGDDIALPNINLEAKNLSIIANTKLKKGRVETIYFDSIKQNRSRLKASYTMGSQKDFFKVTGELDLMQDGISEDLSSRKINKKAKPIHVNMELSRLWMLDNVVFKNVKGFVSLLGEDMHAADISGDIGGAKAYIKVTPQGNKRNVSITSNDGGAIIRGFGINQSIYGGKLKIAGYIDDAQAKHPFLGDTRLTDFTVKKAPALTHLLGVLNLAQLDRSLKGEGLAFEEAIVPFSIEDKMLYINNAKVVGSVLNGTMNGWVGLNPSGKITLSGKIIPFNTISDTAAKIPLLGTLLTGVEKDGIFAADYKISGNRKNPKVTSNPLTAIAPGVLREFLSVFGN